MNDTAILCPIVHEKQSLQLCALHSLNNLLQLSSSSKYIDYNNKNEDYKNGQNEVRIKDCHRFIFPSKVDTIEPFTKNQLDTIANRFISAESKLFIHNNDDNNTSSSNNGICKEDDSQQVSFLKSLRSNHRTPLTGNYSYEVIESALQSKGIKMEWYNIQKQETFKIENIEIDAHSNLSSDEHVIGFIINQRSDKSWYSQIPLVGSTFSGRHWFVITRIRSVVQCTNQDMTSSLFTDNNNTIVAKQYTPLVYLEKETWLVLDSKCSKPIVVVSNQKLVEFLVSIEKEGSSIFRVSAKMTEV